MLFHYSLSLSLSWSNISSVPTGDYMTWWHKSCGRMIESSPKKLGLSFSPGNLKVWERSSEKNSSHLWGPKTYVLLGCLNSLHTYTGLFHSAGTQKEKTPMVMRSGIERAQFPTPAVLMGPICLQRGGHGEIVEPPSPPSSYFMVYILCF